MGGGASKSKKPEKVAQAPSPAKRLSNPNAAPADGFEARYGQQNAERFADRVSSTEGAKDPNARRYSKERALGAIRDGELPLPTRLEVVALRASLA